MVPIVKMIVPSSRYYLKCPYEMTPTRIVVHNTANDASARNEITYMTNNDYETSFHYAVDDKEIVQGIEENRNGWHASDGNGKGNREGIAIEICYSLSGGERFIKAEKNAVDLIVDILNRYNWNIDKVTKHGDYTNKYCPHRTLDMGWDRFLNMIKEKLNETRERPFIIGDIIYNTSDLYLHETAGYGGKSMLLKKGTKGVVKKYHYNNGLYMALGDATSYYDAAWTNEFEKFTKKAPEEE
ncbi:MAG: N-acetylmuramoyl-L-alanine amidase, partial [Bacilli bacterium]|nr:N-acetylmuramoyl-L-alanine amidase [Bacilli bacterium]